VCGAIKCYANKLLPNKESGERKKERKKEKHEENDERKKGARLIQAIKHSYF